MAEIVKKAKTPAKPKAVAKTAVKAPAKAKVVKAKTVAEQVQAVTPSHHEIAQLAQRYWAERGWQDGQAEQDWLRAERELMGIAS